MEFSSGFLLDPQLAKASAMLGISSRFKGDDFFIDGIEFVVGQVEEDQRCDIEDAGQGLEDAGQGLEGRDEAGDQAGEGAHGGGIQDAGRADSGAR